MLQWRFSGLNSNLEGEEMRIAIPGFEGGDRTTLDLPVSQLALLQAAVETKKPVIVVLMNGSALSVNYAAEHAAAIVEAWYPGEEGGRAIAQTLSGANNPAGRLPVTFYQSVDQLPPFDDYSMKERTYRYFHGRPLYPLDSVSVTPPSAIRLRKSMLIKPVPAKFTAIKFR